MKLYFEQIPDDAEIEDYPPDTSFVMDFSPLQRDPRSGALIPKERRRTVSPEEAWALYNRQNKGQE